MAFILEYNLLHGNPCWIGNRLVDAHLGAHIAGRHLLLEQQRRRGVLRPKQFAILLTHERGALRHIRWIEIVLEECLNIKIKCLANIKQTKYKCVLHFHRRTLPRPCSSQKHPDCDPPRSEHSETTAHPNPPPPLHSQHLSSLI